MYIPDNNNTRRSIYSTEFMISGPPSKERLATILARGKPKISFLTSMSWSENVIVKYFIDCHDYVSLFFVLIEMISTSPYGWHGALGLKLWWEVCMIGIYSHCIMINRPSDETTRPRPTHTPPYSYTHPVCWRESLMARQTVILPLQVSRQHLRVARRAELAHQLPIPPAAMIIVAAKPTRSSEKAPRPVVDDEEPVAVLVLGLVAGELLDVVGDVHGGDEARHEGSSRIAQDKVYLVDWCCSGTVLEKGTLLDGDAVGHDVLEVAEVEVEFRAAIVVPVKTDLRVKVHREPADGAVCCVIGSHCDGGFYLWRTLGLGL